MIQEQTKQQISGLPGLMQLPVLGTLFKSRDYVNRQTELMVIVTPYIARAVAQKDLSRPDDGFVDSSDPAAVLLGRLQPHLRRARQAGAGIGLQRQVRLHSGLMDATRTRNPMKKLPSLARALAFVSVAALHGRLQDDVGRRRHVRAFRTTTASVTRSRCARRHRR